MWALIKKEVWIHFASPIFPIAASLFLFISGFGFYFYLTSASANLPEASLRGIISFMAVILLFVTPFLTMRTFAEERKIGTLELLKTSPLSDGQILGAKYLAILFLIALLLLLSLEFPFLISRYGDPDLAPMILSYLGLFLMSAGFAAIGIFMSLLVREQMIAAILTFIVTLLLWFLGEIEATSQISSIVHLESFTLGVLDTGDLAYFLFVILIFLFLGFRVLEAERWK